MTSADQAFLSTYCEHIARIWTTYIKDREGGKFNAMSMKEREKALYNLRRRRADLEQQLGKAGTI